MKKRPRAQTFRRNLHNINLEEALIYIAKASLFIWNNSRANNKRVLLQHKETINNTEQISHYYNSSILAYLASEVISHCRDRKWSFTLHTFNEGIEFINTDIEYENLLEQDDQTFRGIQLIASQLFAQLPLAELTPIFNRFGRYDLIFNVLPNNDSSLSISRLAESFKLSNQGLNFREFLASGMVMFAIALQNNGVANNPTVQPVSMEGIVIDSQTVHKFSTATSITPENFTAQVNHRVNRSLPTNSVKSSSSASHYIL